MERARPQAESLREQALGIIRDAITAGELAEDRIYSAAGLAKQLGMSLSPVREAMMALVTEGTVEAVPNRGFRLVAITEADLEEIIAIRVLLAVPAARQLAAASDDAVVGRLQEVGADAEGEATTKAEAIAALRGFAEATVSAAEAGDVPEFYTQDRRFHEALLEHGLGRRAAEISLRLRDQSRLFRNADRSIAVDSARELPVLVELIDEGRAAEAADLVTSNLYFFKRVPAAAEAEG
ncbi:DNA-binding transcriptional regulator, GntR family [Brevibacterium siliguriense]|uniref:DNA-binding transcriptional regulator, GntR family n=1 Tax=Brevibacterium siliguriense TaxID=1136497 RepID=A0A1H1N681_9MICO|nr:GntR family transcriptional regulator [Brevibacterium siliguriense]SDR93659.1 DNA-binding transcriptional regulator, GntR family [Brevibacterium siliguriense]